MRGGLIPGTVIRATAVLAGLLAITLALLVLLVGLAAALALIGAAR